MLGLMTKVKENTHFITDSTALDNIPPFINTARYYLINILYNDPNTNIEDLAIFDVCIDAVW